MAPTCETRDCAALKTASALRSERASISIRRAAWKMRITFSRRFVICFLRVDSFCLYTARSNYKAKLDVPSPSDIFKAYCFLEKLSSNPLFFNLRILVYTIYQNRSSPSYRTLILINIVYITVIQISVILRIQLGRCVWTSPFISSNVFLTTT